MVRVSIMRVNGPQRLLMGRRGAEGSGKQGGLLELPAHQAAESGEGCCVPGLLPPPRPPCVLTLLTSPLVSYPLTSSPPLVPSLTPSSTLPFQEPSGLRPTGQETPRPAEVAFIHSADLTTSWAQRLRVEESRYGSQVPPGAPKLAHPKGIPDPSNPRLFQSSHNRASYISLLPYDQAASSHPTSSLSENAISSASESQPPAHCFNPI